MVLFWTNVWHCVSSSSPKHSKITDSGCINVLHDPARKSKLISACLVSLHPTILLNLNNDYYICGFLNFYLPSFWVTAKIPEFIIDWGTTSHVNFSTTTILKTVVNITHISLKDGKVTISITFLESRTIKVDNKWTIWTIISAQYQDRALKCWCGQLRSCCRCWNSIINIDTIIGVSENYWKRDDKW